MSTGLPRRLYRSRQDKMLGGVSAGLAAYFDIDPVLVRLIWVLGSIFSGGMLALAYIVLWIVVPPENYTGASASAVRDNMNEVAAEARRVADDVRGAFRHEPSTTDPGSVEESSEPRPDAPLIPVLSPMEAAEAHRRRSMTAGAILLLIGILFLAANLGVFRWLNWAQFWPVVLIALGAAVLWTRSR